LPKIRNKSNLKGYFIQFLPNTNLQRKRKINKNHPKGSLLPLSKANSLQKKEKKPFKFPLRMSSLEFLIWEDLVNNLNSLNNSSLRSRFLIS
jgi:hypothetical protein